MSRHYISSLLFIAFISLQYSYTSEKESYEPLTHYLFAYFTGNETEGQHPAHYQN